MKPSVRDELLVRLDERTQNIWTLAEKQEQHLSKLNNRVSDNETQSAVNKSNIKRIWWVIGLGITGIIAIALAIIAMV